MEASFDQKINVVYLDESRRTPVHRAALDGKHEQVEEKFPTLSQKAVVIIILTPKVTSAEPKPLRNTLMFNLM